MLLLGGLTFPCWIMWSISTSLLNQSSLCTELVSKEEAKGVLVFCTLHLSSNAVLYCCIFFMYIFVVCPVVGATRILPPRSLRIVQGNEKRWRKGSCSNYIFSHISLDDTSFHSTTHCTVSLSDSWVRLILSLLSLCLYLTSFHSHTQTHIHSFLLALFYSIQTFTPQIFFQSPPFHPQAYYILGAEHADHYTTGCCKAFTYIHPHIFLHILASKPLGD